MTVTKSALLARRLGEGDHEIEDVGTVRIRGLSRAEVLEIQRLDTPAEVDRRMLSLAVVDPSVSEADVKVWQGNSPPMEIERLTDAIRALSGMGGGAAKSAYKSVRE